MIRQACCMGNLCCDCGGGNPICLWSVTGARCKASRKDIAPWMLAMRDAESAGVDLPSALTEVMDVKCVFVHGLRDAVREKTVARVETDINQLVHRVDPNARTVVTGTRSSGFIFFETTRLMDVFLDTWTRPADRWGHITVCGHLVGVRRYKTVHYGAHVTQAATRSEDAETAVPAIEVTQPSSDAGGGVATLQVVAHRLQHPIGAGEGASRQVVRRTRTEVSSPVPTPRVVEDMTGHNFNWDEAGVFLELQPDGLSRKCLLCKRGATDRGYFGRPITMDTAHVEGGVNQANKSILLMHLRSPLHRRNVAIKLAAMAEAIKSQTATQGAYLSK